MAYRDLFEIGFSYVQYLLLLIQIATTAFPSYYNVPFNVLRYLNLDLVAVFSEQARQNNAFNWKLPLWIPLDFRLQFTIVSVAIPLLASMIGMYSLAPKAFFVWYFLMLGSLFLVVVGGLMLTYPYLFASSINGDQRWWLLYVGATAAGVMGVGGLLRFAYLRLSDRGVDEADMRDVSRVTGGVLEHAVQNTSEKSATSAFDSNVFDKDGEDAETRQNENLNQILERETARVDFWAAVERTLYVLVTLFFGLSFLGLFSDIIPAFAPFKNSDSAWYLGLVLLFFCALLTTWLLLGFGRKGRMRQFHVQVYVRDHFVSIQLLLVSLLYTPAVRNVIVMFNCQSITCPPGTRFPHAQSLFLDVASGSLCEPCNFTAFNQSCPLSLQLSECGTAITDSRLVADTGISCHNVRAFFMPAAAIMLVSFVISLPILNVILTRISARLLEIEYPIDGRQTEGYTEDEKWYEKVLLSENVAKFIYAPFQRKFKHWRMFFLFQKLAIVVVSTVARTGAGVAGAPLGIGLSLAIHFLLFVYIVIVAPFQRKVENLFMAITQVMLSIVASLGLASTVGAPAPDAVLLITAVCVFILPLLALIFGEVLTFKDEIEHDAEREERIRMAEQQAERQEGDVEAAKLHLTTAADPEGESSKDKIGADGEVQAIRQPTSTMLRVRLAKGNANVCFRFELAAKPATHDFHGKPTILEALRAKAREREAAANQQSLLNLLHQNVSTVSSSQQDGSSGSGGNIMDLDMSAFGAASLNLRGRMGALNKPKNTPQQSTRARENWKRAHEAVVKKLKKDQMKRKGTFFGAKATKQGTKFEKLLEQLLGQVQAEDPLLAGSMRGPSHSAPPPTQQQGAATHASNNPFAQLTNATGAPSESSGPRRRNRNQIQFDGPSAADGSLATSASATTTVANGNTAASSGGVMGLPTFSRNSSNLGCSSPTSNNNSASRDMDEDEDVVVVQGAAAARRQHMQVRMKLKNIYDQQLVKLSLTQQAVDFKINKRTINAINIFFVFSGLLAVLAISFSLVGFFDSVESTFIGGFDFNADMTVATQFAGYSNWTDFTSNCCCLASTDQHPVIPYYAVDVEGWMCGNGNFRERIRGALLTGSPSLVRGTAVRPVCGLVFDNGCQLSVDQSTSTVRLAGCNTSITAQEQSLW